MPELNKEAIAEWVDALRSRRFDQATETLVSRTDDGRMSYCCLGVACEVFADRVGLWLGADGNGDPTYRHENDGVVVGGFGGYKGPTALPEPLRKFLGFENSDPILRPENDIFLTCIHMNDEKMASFDEIADAIERTYLRGDSDA
jgi:hypothetical protein